MSISKRLSPAEMRSAALDAAEAILMETGPAALTLKAVAARIGRTHASLLHHFESASGLHEALGQHMADRHRARMMRAIGALDERRITVRAMVDVLFDSNNEHGGIQLMTWLLLTGNEPMFDPIMQALKDQIELFSRTRAGMAPAQGVGPVSCGSLRWRTGSPARHRAANTPPAQKVADGPQASHSAPAMRLAASRATPLTRLNMP